MACWSEYSQRYVPSDAFSFRDGCGSCLDRSYYPLSGFRRESVMPSLLTDKFGRPVAERGGKATPPPAQVDSAGLSSEHKSSSSESEPSTDSARHCLADEAMVEPAFHFTMNMKNYKPEEILVQADGSLLEVYAVREQGNDKASERSTLRRFIDLPLGVSVDSLTCTLSSDGVMTIATAPEASVAGEAANEPQLQGPPSKTGERSDKVVASTAVPAATGSPTAVATTTTAPSSAAAETAASATSVEAAAEKAPSQTTLVELSPDAGRTHVRLSFRLPDGGFLPEQLEVQRREQTVLVSGSRTEKEGELMSSCTFRKQIELPAQADADQLRVYVESGGKVVLEAPEVEYGDDYSSSDSDVFSDDSICSDSSDTSDSDSSSIGSCDGESLDGKGYSKPVRAYSPNSLVRRSASYNSPTKCSDSDTESGSEAESDENLASSTIRMLTVQHN